MADGIRLGGAYFEISADSAPLIQQMARAEAASKKSAQAIAAATGLPEKAVARYAQTLIRETKSAADAAERSAQRIAAAQQRVTASSQQGGAGLAGLTKGALGFAAAAAGVTVGAAAIHAAMTKVIDVSSKAQQAQLGLNATFGKGAELYTAYAQSLSKTSGVPVSEIQQAITLTSTLAKNYGFTSQQIETLVTRTADLAAIQGKPLVDSVQDVISAMRGEGDAAERLGLALQKDALKSLANLTEEQKKNFDSLSVLEQGQIAYAEFLRQTAGNQSVAAQSADTLGGSNRRLQTAFEELGAAIGKEATPSIIAFNSGMIDAANSTATFIKQFSAARAELGKGLLPGGTKIEDIFGGLLPNSMREAIAGFRQGQADAPVDAEFGPTLTPEISRAAADSVAQAKRAADAQLAAVRAFAAQRKRQISDIADAEEQAARRAAAAEDKRIEAVKVGLEVRREAELRALEDRERATIKDLESRARAEKQASDNLIEQLEREKDARLDAAEAAKDAALEAIEARERELDVSRELEDRARDDERRSEDRAVEDARRVEDRVREAAQEREIKRLEDLRDARVEAVEAEIEAADRASEKRIRNIDRQEDAARRSSERAIRRIEEQADREDERHRRAMQALDDEQDARLGILDAQLRALDAADKAEGAARRTADLTKRVADAQRQATQARGTGTPEQVAEARGDLTRAIRVGDPVSVANATERLKQLAGQGADAIRKADEELAEAQADLREAGVDDARDAERQKLKDAQDAIRDDIAARKRAQEDENRRRKQDIEDDKRAEQDKLRSRLDALGKRKQAEQDAAKDGARALRDRLDAEKRAADEDIARARDVYEAQTEVLNDRRREEDRFRDDQRRAQDRVREDERRAQDLAISAQKDAVAKAFEAERKATDEHYNGPEGTVTLARKAQEATAQAYRDRIAAAQVDFDAEKRQINDVYRNAAKTGLLDLQDQAAANNKTKLDEQILALETWKNDANRYVDEQVGKWKTLADAIEATTNVVRNRPVRATPTPNSSGGVGDVPYGPANPDGDGAGANPPPAVQPSPGPGMGDTSDEVDVDPGRFNVAFGFNQPYTNPFNPAIPNHRGVDLVIAGARDGGRGQPVGAFRPGTVVAATIDPNGGNGIIIAGEDGKYHRYFHFDELNVRPGQTVKRGQRIGVLGASGTEGFPHLHYEVSRGINGDPQDELIDPRPYMRDAGYLFRHPTLTYTPATGERNLIAERRPERLLGGAATAIDRSSGVRGVPHRNEAAVGAGMASLAAGAGGSSRVENSTVVFNGVTYEEAERRQRREQRRRSLLRGMLGGGNRG